MKRQMKRGVAAGRRKEMFCIMIELIFSHGCFIVIWKCL